MVMDEWCVFLESKKNWENKKITKMTNNKKNLFPIIENLNLSKTPHWSAEHVAEFLSMLRNCSSLLRAEALQIASRAISDI